MTLAQLKAASPSGRPAPLLWLLTRHAALRQYASTAYSLLGSAASAADQIEPELIDVSPIGHTSTVWDHLALTVPGGSAGTGAVSDYLDQHKADGPAPFVAFWKALAGLATMTDTDLDQVLRETLDLHSHRLDTWYTALASARSDKSRATNRRCTLAPMDGSITSARNPPRHRGATCTLPRRRTPRRPRSCAAHISPINRVAAVPLRSTCRRRVYVCHKTCWMVYDQAKPLGALLGYQLERALHNVSLDPFIAPLRAFAPIEGVTGDRTIDGLTLLDQRSSVPRGTNGLPTLGSTTQKSIDAQFSILANTVDAVSDLMLAESVHQLVGGNALRAGATVDAIGRGDTPPPVLDVTRTPRRGGIVTHRLLTTLGGVIPSGWTHTPRSQAEPRLAAFAANILGAPARVLAGAQIKGPNGAVVATVAMTLTDLALGPLDVLALSASELAARFNRVAWSRRPSSTPAGSTVALNFARNPAWTSDKLSVNELMTVATSVSKLIAGTRAATGVDFTTPDKTVDAAIDTTELKSRADAAVVALNSALGHFTDHTAPDTALMDAAAFGVPNSVPLLDATAWPVQTTAAQTELQSRSTQVAALEASFNRTGASETTLRDHDIARLQVVFGAGFQVVAGLTAALAGTLPALFGSSATLLANQPLAPVTWLARSARVRAGVARLSESLLYGEALSSSAPLTPVVAQLPVGAGDV